MTTQRRILGRLYAAASAMVTGIGVHNDRWYEGKPSEKIEGPVIRELHLAAHEARLHLEQSLRQPTTIPTGEPRPIGARFQCLTSRRESPEFVLRTYEVTGCQSARADSGTWHENWKEIEERHFRARGVVVWCGQPTNVPPEEARHIMDEGYQLLLDRHPDLAAVEVIQPKTELNMGTNK